VKQAAVARSAGTLAVKGGRVDDLLQVVADRLGDLERAGLRQAIEIGEAADAAALRTTLKRYRALEADAERAQRSLEYLALQASLRGGEILLMLDPGGPGRGKKSERMRAAEEAGLNGREARRLVALAGIEDEVREAIVEQLVAAKKRVTVRAVVDLAERRTSIGTDEWYTPKSIADAARRVFGGRPDCDPASCVVAQLMIAAARWWSASEPELGEAEVAAKVTQAKFDRARKSWVGVGTVYRFPTGEVIEPDAAIEDEAKRAKAFAKAANLHGRISQAHQLRGTVWLNPPYSFPAPFVRAVLEAFLGLTLEEVWTKHAADLRTSEEALDEDPESAATWRARALELAASKPKGKVTEAIILVNVATSTAVGRYLLGCCSAACFVAERISFRDAHGDEEGNNNNRNEQVIFYLGSRPAVFGREFARFGQLMVRAPEQWRAAA
jgi:hypothetical protein